jgi:hypothetical protein
MGKIVTTLDIHESPLLQQSGNLAVLSIITFDDQNSPVLQMVRSLLHNLADYTQTILVSTEEG